MGWGGGEMMVVAVGGGWEDCGTGRLWATSISWLHFTIVVYLFSLTHMQESLNVNHLLVFVSKVEKRKRKKYGRGQQRCGEQGESTVSPAVKTRDFFYLPLEMEENGGVENLSINLSFLVILAVFYHR